MTGAIRTRRQQVDVLIVGGGLTGLLCARELHKSGREVLVVDKGRGFGGRLARRRIGDATFEHGGQLFTARGPRFGAALSVWAEQGLLEPCGLAAGPGCGPGEVWRGRPDANVVARRLAEGLDVRREQRVTAVARVGDLWSVAFARGELLLAHTLVMTPPVPQTLALLAAGEVPLPARQRALLEAVTYERSWVTMAVLDGPSRLPESGLVIPAEGPLDRLCDHYLAGQSAVPAVTIQAGDAFSRKNWERPADEVGRDMLILADSWLGAGVKETQSHRWRYCRPRHGVEQPFLVLQEDPGLLAAGDAFGGTDLESAAESGWAAAAWLMKTD